MKALFFGRAFHSSQVTKGYDRYYCDRSILEPLDLVSYPVELSPQVSNPCRDQIMSFLKGLEVYLGSRIQFLWASDILKTLDDEGITEMCVVGAMGEKFTFNPDPRIIWVYNQLPGKLNCKTFSSYYHSLPLPSPTLYEDVLPQEKKATKKLISFLRHGLEYYSRFRGQLSITGGNSMIGPQVSLGVLRMENVLALLQVYRRQDDDDYSEYRRQVYWALYSRVRYNGDLNSWERPILSTEEKQRLKAWIYGDLPQVGAVDKFINRYMKALGRGEPVSNRFRLITSYYLYFVLKIPWIYGEEYCRLVFKDYHPASNFVNWYLQCMRNRFTRFYRLSSQISYHPEDSDRA